MASGKRKSKGMALPTPGQQHNAFDDDEATVVDDGARFSLDDLDHGYFEEPTHNEGSASGAAAAPTPGVPTASASPPRSASDAARLASLSGLALDKGEGPTARAAAPATHKLPWILLALVVIGGGIYHVVTTGGDAPPATTPTANAEPASGSTTPARQRSLLASGYIAARVPILLSAPTSGRITEVHADSGDHVEKDAVVAVLADGELQAELSLARARLADARRKHRRMRRLARAQAATATQLEQAVGQVQIARAEVQVIEEKLKEMRIRAPIDGTVLEVLAHPGETISGGSDESAGVMRVADLSDLVAEVNVDESDLKHVHLGQDAEIMRGGTGGNPYRGAVREIAEQADRARGTVLVRVAIELDDDHPFRPGMAVQVRFGDNNDGEVDAVEAGVEGEETGATSELAN